MERVKEYVRAGDVFQVNISQRLDLPFDGDPLALYAGLREINPSPFGGIVSFPGMTAVSSSLERLVKVEELMSTETYSHVVHLVSEIVGELSPDHDAVSLLSGMFPGGTITGCPKVRCMEIIEEVEPVRRALYTGSFGYLSPGSRSMDMNIAIRTILLTAAQAHVQTGGGIVADSVPEREYQESLNKAAALVQSLGSSVESLR